MMTPTERILSALSDRDCDPMAVCCSKCFGGCTADSICSAVGLSVADLLESSTPSTSTVIRKTWGNEQYRRRRHGERTRNAFLTSGIHFYRPTVNMRVIDDLRLQPEAANRIKEERRRS